MHKRVSTASASLPTIHGHLRHIVRGKVMETGGGSEQKKQSNVQPFLIHLTKCVWANVGVSAER